jgi:hypothetical protein
MPRQVDHSIRGWQRLQWRLCCQGCLAGQCCAAHLRQQHWRHSTLLGCKVALQHPWLRLLIGFAGAAKELPHWPLGGCKQLASGCAGKAADGAWQAGQQLPPLLQMPAVIKLQELQVAAPAEHQAPPAAAAAVVCTAS